MSTENNNMWRGGDWEQPTPRNIRATTLGQDVYTQVEKRQRRQRRHRIFWRNMRWGLFAIVGIALGVAVATTVLKEMQMPVDMGNGSYYVGPGNGSSGGQGQTATEEVQEDVLVVPTMPQVTQFVEGDLVTVADPVEAYVSSQEAYQNIYQSVVYIETYSSSGMGAGTGIILSEDGYIVTNAHVVSGASTVLVCLWDDTCYEAQLVGWDGEEDLAVLKIEAEDLSPATFGDSEQLVVGDTSYAIGNPLGAQYRSTFTQGMISAVDRYLEIDGVYMSLVQTTAAINMGNSGGALLNESGQVVGITTIKLMAGTNTIEGMGFAVPSARVVRVINQLARGMTVETPALGLMVYAVTDPVRGIYVDAVTEGGGAQAAGIQAGDILVAAGGRDLTSSQILTQVKDSYLVGETLPVTVYRDGEYLDMEIVLDAYDTIHGQD